MKTSPKIHGLLMLSGIMLLLSRTAFSVDDSVDDNPSDHQATSAATDASPIHATVAKPAHRASDESRPYSVQVFVSVSDSLAWSKQQQQTFREQLQIRLRSLTSGLWQCRVDSAPRELQCNTRSDLNELPAMSYHRHTSLGGKSIMLLVAGSSSSIEASAREYDDLTQTLGGVQRQRGLRSFAATPAAAEVVWKAFRPLARIENLADNKSTLLLHGGRLVWPAHATIHNAGLLFQPVVRRASRHGNSDAPTVATEQQSPIEPDASAFASTAGHQQSAEVKVLAWNWLSVVRSEGSLLQCDMHSGLASPMVMIRDGRNRYLAIAANTSDADTTIEVVDSLSGRPLAGAGVVLTGVTRSGSNGGDSRWHGQTDAAGAVQIDREAGQLAFLEIHQGPLRLARLPIVVGHSPRLQVQLATATASAADIADFRRLESNLIEAVARREVLLVRTRNAIVAKDYQRAELLMSQIKALPDALQFTAALASASKSIVGETGQTAEQEPLVAKFENTQKLVAAYLNNATFDQFAAALARQRGPVATAESKTAPPVQPAAPVPPAVPAADDPFGGVTAATAPAANGAEVIAPTQIAPTGNADAPVPAPAAVDPLGAAPATTPPGAAGSR